MTLTTFKEEINKTGGTTKAFVPNYKRTFKFIVEDPKTWKDSIRINDATCATLWQDDVKKEVSALVFHECFDFKSMSSKPPEEC